MGSKKKKLIKNSIYKLDGHDDVTAIQVRIPAHRKEILQKFCKSNHISMTLFIESCI